MGRGIREALGVAEAKTEAALMPDEIDIYRSANLLIDQLGEGALTFAAQQADACWERGNLDGKATWIAVIRAIKELLNQQPPSSDTPLH